MRLTLFVTGGDAANAPQIELDHISPAMHGHHCCHSDGSHSDSFQVSLHHFTPAHARALIEMLTPIAAVVEHKLKVEAEGRHVRFKCSCNLLGLLRDTQGEALEDYKAHVLETAQAPAIAAQEVPDA